MRRAVALFGIGAPRAPVVAGAGLFLRAPESDDYEAWARLRAESRDFLKPWEPTWPDDDLTRAAYRRRLRRYAGDRARDEAYAFFVFRQDDGALMGGATLSNVRRGVAQTATLGYWMGAAHAGRGHMTRAVAALAAHGFGALHLHRIEAACLPANIASRTLLERNRFRHEGAARAYLKIDGNWADHLLFARLAED